MSVYTSLAIRPKITLFLFSSQISYKIFYEYECGEDDTYQSYVASVGIATPLPVLPALEARVAARLEDALWKMSADIAMPSFTITALASLEVS